MRVSRGRITACLLAVALGTALTINTAVAAPTGSSTPGAAAVLKQAEALATSAQASTQKPHDGTSVMVALQQALPQLNAADRSRAQSLLNFTSRVARPNSRTAAALAAPSGTLTPVSGEVCDGDSGNQYFVDVTTSGHFAIYYTLTGTNAVSADYLANTETVLDNVWNTEINQMGFEAPLAPQGGTMTPIRLCNIAPDLYGYCAPIDSIDDAAFSAACTLRNSYASITTSQGTYEYYNPKYDGNDLLAPLKVTAAHEFFHAVQFRQHINEPLWLAEGTAVWMENQVYPAINDYVQYLPFTGIKQPLVPFNAATTFTPYADFALFKAISGYLGDQTIVKQIWNYLGEHQSVSAMDALNHVVGAHKHSLASVLLAYGVWNTLAPHTYPAASLYRPPVWWLHRTLDRNARVLTGHAVMIRPLADAPAAINRGAHVLGGTRLQIGVSGPRGGWFTVRRALSNGTSVVSHYQIGAKGTVITVPFNTTVSYVAITLNNVATSGAARQFGVRATVL